MSLIRRGSEERDSGTGRRQVITRYRVSGPANDPRDSASSFSRSDRRTGGGDRYDDRYRDDRRGGDQSYVRGNAREVEVDRLRTTTIERDRPYGTDRFSRSADHFRDPRDRSGGREERYQRTTDYITRAVQRPMAPQQIIIRQQPQPIIITQASAVAPVPMRSRSASPEQFSMISRREISMERSSSPRRSVASRHTAPRETEDFYYSKKVTTDGSQIGSRVGSRAGDKDEVIAAAIAGAAAGAAADKKSDIGRRSRRRSSSSRHESESDGSMVIIKKKTITEEGSPHRKRNLLAGAAAGIAAEELVRHRRKSQGGDTGNHKRDMLLGAGGGAAAAEVVTRIRARSRARSRSASVDSIRESRKSRRDRRRDESQSRSRSRSRSRSKSRVRTIAKVGAGLAAVGLGAGYLINQRREKKNAEQNAANDPNYDYSDDRSPRSPGESHSKRNIAAAGLGTAALAGIAQHQRNKSRSRSRGGQSRSRSRIRSAVPVALTGAAGAAIMAHHEKKKRQDNDELGRGRSRSRSLSRGRDGPDPREGRSRSRSVVDRLRSRSRSLFRREPKETLPMITDGRDQNSFQDPMYNNGYGYDNAVPPVAAAAAAGAAYGAGAYGAGRSPVPRARQSHRNRSRSISTPSDDGGRRRNRSRSRKKSTSRSRSRSRSRLGDAALAAGAVGAGALAASQYKDRKARKNAERDARRKDPPSRLSLNRLLPPSISSHIPFTASRAEMPTVHTPYPWNDTRSHAIPVSA